jgi:hypothetical protein
MKVKIGDKIFDSEEEPIMIILNEGDKRNISSMHEDVTKYCTFPENWNIEDIKEFMKI